MAHLVVEHRAGSFVRLLTSEFRNPGPHTVFFIRCAVPQGTVLFSTMIVPGLAYDAASLTAPSNAVMLVALPAPTPLVLVGVLTAKKITSAVHMLACMSHVKKRFGLRLETVPSLRASELPSP